LSRATAEAPANIAFVKYWGARDLQRAVPQNPSISMTLAQCVSRTTVEHLPGGEADQVMLAGDSGELSLAPEAFAVRVRQHLDVLRQRLDAGGAFRVATRNSFPTGAGIASSASGFAALTVAVAAALGRELPAEELSVLAQLSGSGSAARSVIGGYVEWPASGPDRDSDADADAASWAEQLAAAEHWRLCDVVAIVEGGPKDVSSLEGHRRSRTSPHYATRQTLLAERLRIVRQAIADRDLAALGPLLEEEAIELHMIAMTSKPPIFYWSPATLTLLATVRELRDEGIPAFATMDAGANVHVICEPEHEPQVARQLAAVRGVRRILRDHVGDGPRLDAEPLF
jgi:diphosphomevalonate decarboxylase